MKIIRIVCLMLGLLFSFLLHAEVIKFVEKDQDGSEHIDRKISDINSELEIQVNVMEIRKQLKIRDLAEFPEHLYKNISIITEALDARSKTLKETEEAIQLYKQGNFGGYVDKLKKAAKGPALLLRIEEIMQAYLEIEFKNSTLPGDQEPSHEYFYIFEAAEEVLASFEKELAEKVRESGIYIQMGAWLITKEEKRPIHLPGFDNLPEIDPYVVPRWQFSPTPEQRREFKKFSEFAKKNKKIGLNVIKASVKQLVEPLVNLLKNKLNQSIQSLIAPFEKSIMSLKSSKGNTKQCLETLKKATNNYIDVISEIVGRYKNIESTFESDLIRLIVDAGKDITKIKKKTCSLKKTFEEQIACIENEIAALPTEVKQLVKKLKNTSNELGKETTKLTKLLTEMAKAKFKKLMNELMDSREFDAAALEFSESVNKLDITNVPEKTELPLKKTGPREKGDVFFVKMVAGRAESDQKETIDSRKVLLFPVLPHIRTVAGLIFARPTSDGGGPFEMAPSYNILFKGFWDKKKRRKSVVYNRIWDFSFGLNLSSLDFNGDKTQELGIGLVFSGIKDYLQIGFGYNVMENEPYYFFGLRIPIIPVVNLGGSN